MTIDACAAGKDVYVEKPLTHDCLRGGKPSSRLRMTINGSSRSACNSEACLTSKKANELIRGRAHIGRRAQGAPHLEPERQARLQAGLRHRSTDLSTGTNSWVMPPISRSTGTSFRNWRWFWDFGGGIFTDLMVHWIDVAHWILRPQSSAIIAASIGDHFTTKGHLGDAGHRPDVAPVLGTAACRRTSKEPSAMPATEP